MSASCRECGRPLSDATSRAFRIGPECRRGLSPEQLHAALRQAVAEADPGYIPPQRPASVRARRTSATARAIVAEASAPARVTCDHGGLPGRCPMCRREADPEQAADRIIAEVQADRRDARAAAYRRARGADQLALVSA